METKPCPFCGGRAKFQTLSRASTDDVKGINFGICCGNCGAHPSISAKNYRIEIRLLEDGEVSFVTDDRQEAVDIWNTRKGEEEAENERK